MFPCSELFWSAFSRIRTEYGEMRTRIAPNTDIFDVVRNEENSGRQTTARCEKNTERVRNKLENNFIIKQ